MRVELPFSPALIPSCIAGSLCVLSRAALLLLPLPLLHRKEMPDTTTYYYYLLPHHFWSRAPGPPAESPKAKPKTPPSNHPHPIARTTTMMMRIHLLHLCVDNPPAAAAVGEIPPARRRPAAAGVRPALLSRHLTSTSRHRPCCPVVATDVRSWQTTATQAARGFRGRLLNQQFYFVTAK